MEVSWAEVNAAVGTRQRPLDFFFFFFYFHPKRRGPHPGDHKEPAANAFPRRGWSLGAADPWVRSYL